MSKKAETLFRTKFQNRLKDLPSGWFESIQQKTIHGTPDMLGCIRGRFVALEFKAHSKAVVSELQKLKLKRIRTAGGYGFLVYPENADIIFDVLKSISKGRFNAEAYMEAIK